ncbi:hypothetical protein R7Q53_000949 [Morganella morganii]|nr:hypothetical protein [Morganella morganii]
MSKNWIRECQIIVADENGDGIDLSELRVTFNITRPNTAYPAIAIVKVFNLNKETENRLRQYEFKQIIIVAGYKDNSSQIFSGQIQYTYAGRENTTDTYVVIQSAEGDQAYSEAIVSQTVAAGYTQPDIDTALMKDLEKYGMTAGLRGEYDQTVAPRGKVLFGMHRDEMTCFAKQNNADWRYTGDSVDVVPKDNYINEIILHYDSGLIGTPEQTIGGGINVMCMINPDIKPGTLIHLDNAGINLAGLSNKEIGMNGGHEGSVEQPSPLDIDGEYKVITVSYFGDTRGNSWYQELICIARNEETLLNQSALQAMAVEA